MSICFIYLINSLLFYSQACRYIIYNIQLKSIIYLDSCGSFHLFYLFSVFLFYIFPHFVCFIFILPMDFGVATCFFYYLAKNRQINKKKNKLHELFYFIGLILGVYMLMRCTTFSQHTTLEDFFYLFILFKVYKNTLCLVQKLWEHKNKFWNYIPFNKKEIEKINVRICKLLFQKKILEIIDILFRLTCDFVNWIIWDSC